jgi:hypothetical protein
LEDKSCGQIFTRNDRYGAGIPELIRFQEHFHDYKIVFYEGLNCDSIMFEGHVESSERLNLLYDDCSGLYHVITNLTGATKRYASKALIRNVGVMEYICDQTCSDCMPSPLCMSAGIRIPCEECNRHFRGQICFDKTVGGGKKETRVSVREFAGCVAILLRVKITSVTNGTARTIKRIKMPDTCAK